MPDIYSEGHISGSSTTNRACRQLSHYQACARLWVLGLSTKEDSPLPSALDTLGQGLELFLRVKGSCELSSRG